jgi:hypothetical protein
VPLSHGRRGCHCRSCERDRLVRNARARRRRAGPGGARVRERERARVRAGRRVSRETAKASDENYRKNLRETYGCGVRKAKVIRAIERVLEARGGGA